ncbi:MAG: LmbE family protein, partial [Acidobacteria bacterium]
EGERYRVFEVEPEFSVRPEELVTDFANGAGKTVRVSVTNRSDGHASATLSLRMPPGWSATPSAIPLAMTKAGESRDLDFRVSAAANAGSGPVRAVVEVGGRTVGWSVNEMQYLHIPVQTVLEESKGTLLRLDLKKEGQRLGYIMGSGDFVPEALRQIGYEVRLLSDEDLTVGNLSSYDAIVVGIRAYNTRPVLSSVQSRLLTYVSSGGTLVVQYNTLQDLIPAELGPYPLRVSRERVSVEEAPVRLTASQHTLLTTPNRITSSDFEGWVQERGLYFPGQWDSRYEAVISTADPGEPALEGGVLYARYGEGVFIYTSYAWFRQLPAGVPGAYRFFANLVSARGSKNGS